MMVCPITWDPDIPEDIRAIVEPHLRRWRGLVPTWCQEFIVRYRPAQDGRMETKVNYRNRWAVIVVTGVWLGETEVEREASLVHELLHICLEPLSAAVVRIIEDVTEKDTPVRALVDSMFTDGLEASVEDTARCIIRVREAG